MKNLVSIFAGHDANITFYNADKDEYHLIELERLVLKGDFGDFTKSHDLRVSYVRLFLPHGLSNASIFSIIF